MMKRLKFFALIFPLIAGMLFMPLSASAGKTKVDVLLTTLISKGITTKNVHKASPKQLVNVYTGRVDGKLQVLVDVFIQASPSAIPKLKNLGVNIRTITNSGIMTAAVPLVKIKAIAALSEVARIEAGKRIKKYLDVSREATGINITGTYPVDAPTGTGAIVGVIDSGIDWDHLDFKKQDGSTRIHALWDQSDYSDENPPGNGKDYGYVYNATMIQDCINGQGSHCVQKDIDGHGTHVAGTAAGNGRAFGYGSSQYQFAGVAPDATLIIVKFDFEGDRNSDAAIIDAVDWIFLKADALGMPAVINMSLGTDYGPHDGSTLEERGVDDLTGVGRIVVAAAGNAGCTGDNTWGNISVWGYPLHGSGTISEGGPSTIKVSIPGYTPENINYKFFDIWYQGSDRCQVQITTPAGKKYPPNFLGRNKKIWLTGGIAGSYNTTEGTIIVNNATGDPLEWYSESGDNELYIEISDYYGVNPSQGEWTIDIFDRGGLNNGAYNAWSGNSDSLIETPVLYEGKSSNNTMTVGCPATANNVIAIGAYTTRMGWEYKDLNDLDGVCTEETPCCQTYNDYPNGPLSYYDPYFIDEDLNTTFNHDFSNGHQCYYEPDLGDTAESFESLAYYSSRGPSRDDRTKPEVCAPGVGIVASLSQDALAKELSMPVADTYFIRTNRVFADGLHAVLQGTSMAAPHGTGAVALLLAADGTLTPSQVRNILQRNARADEYTGVIPNFDWGYGKLDITESLKELICTSNEECDDGNPCTSDICEGSCQNDPVSDGTECGSNNICCGGSCITPACLANADCSDGEECTEDTCTYGGTCNATCSNSWPSCGIEDGCCDQNNCTPDNDPDCTTCKAAGEPCETASECCSDKCVGRPGSKKCI